MSSGDRAESHARRLWLAALLACLLPATPAFAAVAKPARPAAAKQARAAERAWIERSVALAKAAKEHAILGDFRRDILEHRERLRAIVRANPKPPGPLLGLHRSMILTNALLNAASECHSGGRLACPADLMRQIEAQLKADLAHLNAVERGAR